MRPHVLNLLPSETFSNENLLHLMPGFRHATSFP